MSEPDLTLLTYIVRRADLPAASLGHSTRAVMNSVRDHYYGLSDVSAMIWDLLEQPTSIGDLCLRLQEVYQVEPNTCCTETLGFLRKMIEEDLIEVVIDGFPKIHQS